MQRDVVRVDDGVEELGNSIQNSAGLHWRKFP
jgi:hypothetical protein